MARVVNRRDEREDVYIGRGSPLGNPFTSMQGGASKAEFFVATRAEAVASYRVWLWNEIKEGRITPEYLRSLDGKKLGCYCYPKACHGDIIVRAVAWAKEKA